MVIVLSWPPLTCTAWKLGLFKNTKNFQSGRDHWIYSSLHSCWTRRYLSQSQDMHASLISQWNTGPLGCNSTTRSNKIVVTFEQLKQFLNASGFRWAKMNHNCCCRAGPGFARVCLLLYMSWWQTLKLGAHVFYFIYFFLSLYSFPCMY